MDINGSMLLIPTTPFEFVGSGDLSQFTVLSSDIYAKDSGTRVEVVFRLRRIFVSQLANTYLPTLGLLLIAVVTLQFDDSKMEFALGLTLTVMLVMYTMYQSISISVTTTAYLKWLDIWLFYCLLMPFVIFMIEIVWLLQKNRELNSGSGSGKGWVTDEKKLVRRRNFCRFVTYAMNLVFIFVYVVVSIRMYNN